MYIEPKKETNLLCAYRTAMFEWIWEIRERDRRHAEDEAKDYMLAFLKIYFGISEAMASSFSYLLLCNYLLIYNMIGAF